MRLLLRLIPICVVLLGLAGLAFARRDPPLPEPPSLVLLAAGETLGHLEPCECVSGMSGGFPRRLSALAREARSKVPLLHVDTGNLTASSAHHPRLLTLKTQAALELFARGGVHAVAVGDQDLRLGAEALARYAKEAGVRLLLANAKGPFPGSAVVEVGERRVWIGAVLDPELGDPTGQLTLDDPDAALRRELTNAPKDALRVVLYRGSRASMLERLKPDLGVHVIVCGNEQKQPAGLSKHGSAWVVETPRDARSLARLAFPKQGDPTLTRLELDEQIPDDPWARERVDRYYDAVRSLPEPPRKPVKAGGSFVGSRSCAGCHQEAFKIFEGTKHRHAQERVTKARPEMADVSECIRCHVTGFGFESGFESMQDTPHLGEVGCESCHGVGEKHIIAGPNGKRGFGVRTGFPESWRALCVQCHDPSNSPNFDFEAYLEKIKHWKDRK